MRGTTESRMICVFEVLVFFLFEVDGKTAPEVFERMVLYFREINGEITFLVNPQPQICKNM